MGVQLRFKVVSVAALVSVAAVGSMAACGSDDGGGPAACQGLSCDGGTSDATLADAPADRGSQDGGPSDPGPKDAALADGSESGSDADAFAGDGGIVCTGQPGTLDPSFGDGGMVWLTYPFSGANAVTTQPDGKIVVGGYIGSKLAIVRLMPDGSLDPAFGTAGLVQMDILTRNNGVRALALQSDGKIVVAGEAHATGVPAPFVLLRQLGDGGLDTSFGDGGVVLTTYAGRDALANGVFVLPGGQIVVGGYSESRTSPDGSQDYEVARYNADGTLDLSFGSSGRATIDVRSTADGPGLIARAGAQLVVAGASLDPNDTNRSDISAVRLASNGSLDLSFGANGKYVSNYGDAGTQGFALAIDSSGRAIIGGMYKADFALVRLGSTGTPDPSWGDGGLITTDFSGRGDVGTSVLVQPDGRVVAVGFSSVGAASSTIAIGAARYLSTGALDLSFGTAGRALTMPLADTHLGASGASLDECHVLAIGTWGYDLAAQPKSAMGIARYWR